MVWEFCDIVPEITYLVVIIGELIDSEEILLPDSRGAPFSFIVYKSIE